MLFASYLSHEKTFWHFINNFLISPSLLFLLLLIFTSNLSTMPPRALMPCLDHFPTIYDVNMYCSLNIFEPTFQSSFFVLSKSGIIYSYNNNTWISSASETLKLPSPCLCLSFHRLNRCCLVSLRFLRLFFWLDFVSRRVQTIFNERFLREYWLFFS